MAFPTSAEIKVKLGGLGAGALAIITLIFTYCGVMERWNMWAQFQTLV